VEICARIVQRCKVHCTPKACPVGCRSWMLGPSSQEKSGMVRRAVWKPTLKQKRRRIYSRFVALRADLHPATRSARRGPRACGARRMIFLSFSQPFRFTQSGINPRPTKRYWAQARLGPRWANLSSRLGRFILVAMTVSPTLCESLVAP
jgi:hypothetical protein